MDTTATTLQDLADRYIAAWNETDPAARRHLVDASWAEDARYTDPLVAAEGRDAVDAMLGAVQAQFPGLVFRLGGPVDAHHDIARFTWELGPAGGEALVVGFDVLVADADGRIAQVHGFLDKVPAV
ncbi:nuclear transport factor 2 family protein [Streptacidiphilus anmyonensis]|uniref:nuclear transport factor 2 family protein n=1 Tax=Streptacidiphilus anmyonensis TaxID=405782 RepID=UPI0005A6615C|nr:nuclear transport factor 2 family protein [Streptacidiphilus anmyonensis]